MDLQPSRKYGMIHSLPPFIDNIMNDSPRKRSRPEEDLPIMVENYLDTHQEFLDNYVGNKISLAKLNEWISIRRTTTTNHRMRRQRSKSFTPLCRKFSFNNYLINDDKDENKENDDLQNRDIDPYEVLQTVNAILFLPNDNFFEKLTKSFQAIFKCNQVELFILSDRNNNLGNLYSLTRNQGFIHQSNCVANCQQINTLKKNGKFKSVKSTGILLGSQIIISEKVIGTIHVSSDTNFTVKDENIFQQFVSLSNYLISLELERLNREQILKSCFVMLEDTQTKNSSNLDQIDIQKSVDIFDCESDEIILNQTDDNEVNQKYVSKNITSFHENLRKFIIPDLNK